MRLVLIMLAGFLSQTALAIGVLLSTGSNQSFDTALPTLSYAATDAEQFAAAMQSVGMSPNEKAMVKTNPSRDEFITAFDGVLASFTKNSEKSVKKFIFYFSGHSDERGLHLRDGLFTKEELHGYLGRIPARTKVVILDSCYASSIATKGIKPITDMMPLKLSLDEPSGSIFLTATSARDVAIESNTMGGSVFTRHLIAGLFGKADSNTDGVVTANELYEYAFRETQLTSYLLPTSQPQRPELISDLKGRGAVMLAYPAGKTGTLRLLADLSGTVSIQSMQGVTSLELAKPRGRAIDLPLPSGPYRMWIRDGGAVGYKELAINLDHEALVASNDIEWRASENQVTSKGTAVSIEPHSKPFYFGVFAGVDPNVLRSWDSGRRNTKGLVGEMAVSHGDSLGLPSGLGIILAYRDEDHRLGGMFFQEKRGAAYWTYTHNLLYTSRHYVGLAFDGGLGLAASHRRFSYSSSHIWNSDSILGPNPFDDMLSDPYLGPYSASEFDRYPVGRVGTKMRFLKDAFWLGISYELDLRMSGKNALPLTPKAWQTLGLGLTL